MTWINIEDGLPPKNIIVCVCHKHKKGTNWLSTTIHEKLLSFVEEDMDVYWTYLPQSLCPMSKNTTDYEEL